MGIPQQLIKPMLCKRYTHKRPIYIVYYIIIIYIIIIGYTLVRPQFIYNSITQLIELHLFDLL